MRAEANIADVYSVRMRPDSTDVAKREVGKLTAKDLFISSRDSQTSVKGRTLTGALGRTLKAALPDVTVMLKCAVGGDESVRASRDWFQVETPWKLRNLDLHKSLGVRWQTWELLVEKGFDQWIGRPKSHHYGFPLLCGTTLQRSPLLTQAIAIEAMAGVDDALDYIYREFDALMWAGDLRPIDQALANKAEDLSIDLILALLTATLPIKEQLTERDGFYERAYQALKARHQYEDGLFDGL